MRTTAAEIDLPPLEECISNKHSPPELRKIAPLMERFDMRFHPDHVGWTVGQPSGRGELSAWFRMIDDREPDPIELLMVVDALPPVTFDLGQMGWAPTLELTVHVRARPAPGWLKVRHADPQHRGRDVRGGLRGLGLGREAGGAVASAGAAAARPELSQDVRGSSRGTSTSVSRRGYSLAASSSPATRAATAAIVTTASRSACSVTASGIPANWSNTATVFCTIQPHKSAAIRPSATRSQA